MSEILGKVTTASHEIPRGADVSFRISVPEQWLAEGRTIEIELPRNLTCAKCSGGGCSVCGNAGAITLRSRTDLPELVQVVLPLFSLIEASIPSPARIAGAGSTSSGRKGLSRPIMIRVPECGGLPDSNAGEIARGLLLLTVEIGEEASSNVRILDEDSIDSSKMLRAVVRTSGKSPVGPDFKTVVLPRRSRAPKGLEDSLLPAPHVASVGAAAAPWSSPPVGERQPVSNAAISGPSASNTPAVASSLQENKLPIVRSGSLASFWIILGVVLVALAAAVLGWIAF